jgi:hypothetical protein
MDETLSSGDGLRSAEVPPDVRNYEELDRVINLA